MKKAAELLRALNGVPSRAILLDLFADDEFKLLGDLLAAGRIKLLGTGDGPTFVVLAEHVNAHLRRGAARQLSHSSAYPTLRCL